MLKNDDFSQLILIDAKRLSSVLSIAAQQEKLKFEYILIDFGTSCIKWREI